MVVNYVVSIADSS